ncbi:hypothetical protein BVRB_3g067880 [Beta vulgaris subsp. vulgaris]|uniref:Uncharacterized protein n=1 Tax=Beta vulgaris subsp. vulgaris TaxID=3555 RepID=A0A0J8E6R3_BETVV|nr:uncharacterized protein LOC104906633 isoform X2 [Beta vulgaris subsp. vulgaris]KMS98895.1 hypothetical protein BVRB_3g067880 [Beta vulgaris subsp. vulgaris]
MRKSLGGSYSGGNGGQMLRSAGKVNRRTKLNHFQESLPSSNNNSSSSPTKICSSSTKDNTTSKHALSLSSPVPSPCTSNSNNNSINGLSLPNYFITNNEEEYNYNEVANENNEWECLENYYDPIFGVLPSTREVQHALLSLQQVLPPHSSPQFTSKEILSDVEDDMDDQTTRATYTVQSTSSKGSEYDWIEPSMHPYDAKLVTQSPGWERVYDAFHLLQTEPTVQKMVVSLSSDKAVWDAVLNNDAVREIRDSYRNAAECLPSSPVEKPDPSTNLSILKWMFVNMKVKFSEVLGNISQFVGDILKPLDGDKEEESYAFSDKLKSTFLLTVVVLLIVVVARGHKA